MSQKHLLTGVSIALVPVALVAGGVAFYRSHPPAPATSSSSSSDCFLRVALSPDPEPGALSLAGEQAQVGVEQSAERDAPRERSGKRERTPARELPLERTAAHEHTSAAEQACVGQAIVEGTQNDYGAAHAYDSESQGLGATSMERTRLELALSPPVGSLHGGSSLHGGGVSRQGSTDEARDRAARLTRARAVERELAARGPALSRRAPDSNAATPELASAETASQDTAAQLRRLLPRTELLASAPAPRLEPAPGAPPPGLTLPEGEVAPLNVDSPLLREVQRRLGMRHAAPAAPLVEDRHSRFDVLQARNGNTTARGFVARTPQGPAATLLLSTPYAEFDFKVVGKDGMQVQLMLGDEWFTWDKQPKAN